MLITSRDRDMVRKYCIEGFGLSEVEADQTMERALQEITLAADFDRRKEIGKAVIRFDDIYDKCSRVQDQKTALQTEINRCKLLGLYPTGNQTAKDETPNEENETIVAVRGHLLPLGLGDETTSTEELARLAALKLMEHIDA